MSGLERLLWRAFHWLLRMLGLDAYDTVPISGWCELRGPGGEILAANTNTFVTTGKTAIGDALIDKAAQWDTGITYCAIGTGTGTPGLSNTTLGTEAGTRQAIDSGTRSGNTLTFTTDFLAAECNVAIAEMGLFGTSTAGAGADSGVMFARSLVSYDNSGGSPINLTMVYYLRIGLVA